MMAGLTDIEAVQKVEGLVEQQGKIIERLKKWRAEEFKRKSKLTDIRVEFGKTEDAMARLHRQKTISVVQDPELASVILVDPRDPTGGPTQEWAEMCVERALRNDKEWQDMLGKFYKIQDEAAEIEKSALEAQSNVLEASEELQSKNAEMRMWSALFGAIKIEEI